MNQKTFRVYRSIVIAVLRGMVMARVRDLLGVMVMARATARLRDSAGKRQEA